MAINGGERNRNISPAIGAKSQSNSAGTEKEKKAQYRGGSGSMLRSVKKSKR